ncbi:MAG TPA: hypothetical protein VHM91_14170, partial [Verrucomicrobiales bacterium]|nr:hypothetical protein [Verrucomicrobiales bacterium]
GAKAAPELKAGAEKSKSSELSQSELESRLADEAGPLRNFVSLVECSIHSGRIAEVEALVDREAILSRATTQISIEGDQTVRNLFCDSTKRAWDERGVTKDYAGTKFVFLRARNVGGRDGLLFRSSSPGGGINYALFTVTEAKPGDFRITDIFVVGLNEFLSDTLQRTWVNVAAGLLEKQTTPVKGVDPAYVANIQGVAEMSRQLQAGKPEAVLSAALKLPESVQKARTVMLMRIEAAERVSAEERDAAYAAWLTVYPDEMDLPLKFAHFYTSHQRWDDAARVIRKLMAKLGEDAMLKMELGNILYRRESEEKLASAAGLSAKKS